MKGEFCGFIASLLNTKPNRGIWKMPERDDEERVEKEEKGRM